MLVLGGIQAALIGGLSLGIGWWAYLVLWLVPVYCFSYLTDNFRSWADHSFPEADQVADEYRLVNYHSAHHLWPSIPYYNLPVADTEVRSLPAARGMEWRRSYLGYLARYWLALPLDVCRVRAAVR